MTMPKIPYAREVYEVREGCAATLHVVTDLVHDRESPGFRPTAHEEMMSAIRFLMGLDLGEHYRPDWTSYVIHSPDQP